MVFTTPHLSEYSVDLVFHICFKTFDFSDRKSNFLPRMYSRVFFFIEPVGYTTGSAQLCTSRVREHRVECTEPFVKSNGRNRMLNGCQSDRE